MEVCSSTSPKPRYLFVTILIGNTIVTTAAAVVVALLTVDAAGTFGWNKELALGIEVVVVTFVVIVLSEVTPKVIAARLPAALARHIAFPLYCVSIVFYPLTAVLVAMVKAFESRLGLHQRQTALKSDEIKTLADVVSEHGAIDQEERSIIHSMMNAKEMIVREVMTPLDPIPCPRQCGTVVRRNCRYLRREEAFAHPRVF